jgi:hypothetical protein
MQLAASDENGQPALTIAVFSCAISGAGLQFTKPTLGELCDVSERYPFSHNHPCPISHLR